MKHLFINKKTGAEARVIAMYLDSDGVMQVDGYDTVEDLMDDYAAYEKYEPPKEPLIKDEKIRKAVRAWAEVCEIESDDAIMISGLAPAFTRFYTSMYGIDIKTESSLGLDEHKDYTIAELCGEEEE